MVFQKLYFPTIPCLVFIGTYKSELLQPSEIQTFNKLFIFTIGHDSHLTGEKLSYIL
jgi:hypothetical protein